MIVKKIYDFFYQNNLTSQENHKSLHDFLYTLPDYVLEEKDGVETTNLSLALSIDKICKQMVEDGLLIKIKTGSVLSFLDKYLVCIPEMSSNPDGFRKNIEYGCHDFKYEGFTLTRSHFTKSVLPIVGSKDGRSDVGSAYYIGDNMIVTAAHCIEGLDEFQVLDYDEKSIPIKEIWYPEAANREAYDLAIIITENALDIASFDLDDPQVLDKVLTMGFPPIPGLNFVQTAETASVGAFFNPAQKSSEGEVVSETDSYISRMDYFLINARVKGGNSGGPVINEYGKVIGTVVQIPFDNQGGSEGGRYDIMGYGVCLPSKYVRNLINNHQTVSVSLNDNKYYSLDIKNN